MTEAEFLEIYREHAALVFRFCAFRTGSAQDAEDLCAEAFARLLEKGGSVQPKKRVAWLHAVARNLCADWGRGRRSLSLDDAHDVPIAPHELVWIDDEVRAAVAGLSAALQETIFLRIVEDMPFARIAWLLGIGEPAARMRYSRAIGRLRSKLPEARA